MKRNILLLSNSTLHGSSFLEWASETIKDYLTDKNVKEVLFIPYALKDMDSYTDTARKAFVKLGFKLNGIHTFENPVKAVGEAEALFVGGGNTFRLLKLLYDNHLLESIKKRVLQDGMVYIGSSAGTNVATPSIHTTNDMPIVYPPSFQALDLVPFNINPHYIDPSPASTHMGETREERIRQFHEESLVPVLGLREGSLLWIDNEIIKLEGNNPARLFIRKEDPKEFETGSDLTFLLKS